MLLRISVIIIHVNENAISQLIIYILLITILKSFRNVEIFLLLELSVSHTFIEISVNDMNEAVLKFESQLESKST